MIKRMSALLLFAGLFASVGEPAVRRVDPASELAYGSYPVGFKLIVTGDPTRSYPDSSGAEGAPRPMRIYIWYPAIAEKGKPLAIGDFVRWAGEDFAGSGGAAAAEEPGLPVPIKQGLSEEELAALLVRPLQSRLDPPAAAGEFPLLVLGQGLYYESPLSNAVLCEYLASRGNIIATCPLLGTRYRLANQSAEDLETQVRDMEFALAEARATFGGKTGPIGIIGYDLGGMAGLILAMRRPEIAAFLSMDSGIDMVHHSGLPAAHPGYREDCFVIPWMHMTQARFVEASLAQKPAETLSGRKKYGDMWLVSVPTENHGGFSSYAAFGIRRAIRGYWEGFADNARDVHDDICRLAGDFFEAAMKPGNNAALARLEQAAAASYGRLKLNGRKGAAPPESSRSLIRRIIGFGLNAVRPEIRRIHAADPGTAVVNEAELRWLAYHFLLWWGRENEAMETFLLNVELHPKSADAWVGLGEAHFLSDRKDEAIASFRKALEINPEFPNLKAVLDDLLKK